jgi:hypothetical protein
MTRTRSLELGVDEWSCTECGRRLLMRMPPAFEQIVLERGDEAAAHVGGTGGLQIAEIEPYPANTGGPSAPERGWLAEHGIAWGPDSDL